MPLGSSREWAANFIQIEILFEDLSAPPEKPNRGTAWWGYYFNYFIDVLLLLAEK